MPTVALEVDAALGELIDAWGERDEERLTAALKSITQCPLRSSYCLLTLLGGREEAGRG